MVRSFHQTAGTGRRLLYWCYNGKRKWYASAFAAIDERELIDKVLAFDIQEQALTATQKRLNAGHVPENYRLLLESHANMAEYATPDSVSCIVFNFGYLPGGDHSLATRGETSIQALTQALTLLKKGGMISLLQWRRFRIWRAGSDPWLAEKPWFPSISGNQKRIL